MNTMLQKLRATLPNKKSFKSFAISIVILFEVLAITTVSVFAWVETVSSIKIEGKGEIDTYVYTDAMIGSGKDIIDMGSYFKQAGDMHLAPASSANGKTMYFPQAGSTSTKYRKGNSSDKNTNYLSVTFRIKTDTNADFFFTKAPTFSALGSDIRVSVTSQSEGSNEEAVTQIYALTKSTSAVVNSTTGSTATATVEAFADHIKGKGSSARLFNVVADETKVVTINVWLQKKSTDMNSAMAQKIKIEDLGIVSSLTPRRVTLLPTAVWEPSGTTTYFYAWCWTEGASSELFKLEKDEESEHYSFDYSGSYQKTLFIRSGNANLTTDNIGDWSSVWTQTEDTAIPASPVDPTFIIKSMSDGNEKKSTGEWVEPATIKVGYVTGQSSTCGTLSAKSYIGTTNTTTVLEQTSSSSTMHKDTVHAWPGKKLTLTASAKTGYKFVGWFTNEEGTGTAVSTSTTYEPTAPSIATEVTYYAKFNEVATITLYKYVDGSSSSTAAGTIKIDSDVSGTGTSVSKTVNKGTSVTLSATANTGYTLDGIYSVATGGTRLGSSSYNFTANLSETYYARFTTNTHNVKANAYYSTNGTTYTAGSTGGTVKAGSSAAGSTSTASNVKYNNSVTLVATPASGYSFVGWYDGTATNANLLSTSTSYSYKLTTDADVNVYARFVQASETVIYITPRSYWGDDYYIRLYVDSGSNVTDGVNSTGFVKAEYDKATGYYKATISSSRSGTFNAILAKDTNYTGKVPSTGGRSGTLGKSYIFDSGSSGALTAYNNERCYWFIDGTSWIKNNVNNGTSTMIVWDAKNSTDINMTRVNDVSYIIESTATNGDKLYFKEQGNNWKNEWSATIKANYNQYTATNSGGAGSWTN